MSGKTLEKRAQILFKALVERYIRDGEPVGSKTLAEDAGLPLSPATVRHVLSELEEQGYLHSPHTSAGRVPTSRGYRLFVDSLLTIHPPAQKDIQKVKHELDQALETKHVLSVASHLVSTITSLTGLVTMFNDCAVSGQAHLLESVNVVKLERLKELFDALEKGEILRLMAQCLQGEGVRLYIGEESGYDDYSMVTSSYSVGNQNVGVLAVIGPKRMAYDRIIPAVEITAKLLSSALNHEK